MARTFLVVAGELSGDGHGAEIMKHFNAVQPATRFIGLGGNAMTEQGLRPLHHVRKLAVTGFVEVIRHLPFFRRVMRDILEACRTEQPDAAILIDYPGFNIRLGHKLKKLGIPVYYYISPQVWAWKQGRVEKLRRFVQRIFCIFPFEEEFYTEHDVPATFVGHPILDKQFELPDKGAYFYQCGLDVQEPVVGLLPGSRQNEILRHNRPLIDAVKAILDVNPRAQFLLAGVSSVPRDLYEGFRELENVSIRIDEAHAVMAHADVVVSSSGTATLETAFLGTPLIVIYRLSPLSYFIGKRLVQVEHISMPNLIMGERIVPELIQTQANGGNIAGWVLNMLEDERNVARMKGLLGDVKARLGLPGGPERVVKQILSELRDAHGAQS